MEFRTFKIRHDETCPVCGKNPTITKPIDYEQFCGVPILDPKSLEETRQEAQRAKSPAQAQATSGLDEKGLPPNYAFKPDWEITPRDVKAMLDRKDNFVLIDCRLPNEYEITHIEGAKLLPLQQLGQRIGEIRNIAQEKIVVHCRSGARSLQFTQMLRQQGFKDVKSMAGGILLWNKDVNPGGPQY
jgi:adenylyltransferase/sulfurtransferase